MTLSLPGTFIFDNDGVLQDTEPHYERAYKWIAKDFGCPPPTHDLLMAVKGIDLRDVAQKMIGQLGLPLSGYEAFKQELDQRLLTLAPSAGLLPGVRETIQALREAGRCLGVATSSTKEVFALKTQHHQDLYRSFDCIVTGDDPEVKEGKPAPYLLLVCARRLGVLPADCLYVGDNPVDIEAAHAAGMLALAVPSPGRLEGFEQADWLLPSLEGFML